jgi:ribose-phosphate pyrophosphokinase
VLVDDIVDTANTLCKAAAALKDAGATSVHAYCTHPVLSGAAVDNIKGSVLDGLVVTDTIPLSEEARKCSRIRQLTVTDLIAEAMMRVHMQESVSSLFME